MDDKMTTKRVFGVQPDRTYKMIKNVIRHNKIKTHEIEESKKVEDIRKNNAHLLDKLLEISKGKNCKVS